MTSPAIPGGALAAFAVRPTGPLVAVRRAPGRTLVPTAARLPRPAWSFAPTNTTQLPHAIC